MTDAAATAPRARRPRRRRRLEPGINLIPMLDVILCLILFFLLATQIKTKQGALKVSLPPAQTADAPGAGEAGTVTIDSDGKMFYEGRELGDAELELQALGLAKRGELRMNIHGDERANFGRIIQVMDICRRAGLQEVLINAKPEAARQ